MTFDTWWADVAAAEVDPDLEPPADDLDVELPRGCPAVGCTAPVSHNGITCRTHWLAIPAELRENVWRQFARHGENSSAFQVAIDVALETLTPAAVAA